MDFFFHILEISSLSYQKHSNIQSLIFTLELDYHLTWGVCRFPAKLLLTSEAMAQMCEKGNLMVSAVCP